MSRSALFITTICITLALLIMVIASGCTSAPSGSAGTSPVTSAESAAVSSPPIVASDSMQSATAQYPLFGAGVMGNVFGSAVNPSAGIDTIQFYLSPARSIDLTKWEIVVTPTGSTPVTYGVSTSDATGSFTATNEDGKTVTSVAGSFTVSIKMTPIAPGTKVRIEMRPSGGTAKDDELDISRTMPPASQLTSGTKTPIF